MADALRSSALASAMMLAGCSGSHIAEPPDGGPLTCGSTMPCPAGMACDFDGEGNRFCVDVCDPRTTRRCTNGAACMGGGFHGSDGLCALGGPYGEGEIVGDSACAFGLRPTDDWTSDPLVERCEPACDRDADCRSGETCSVLGSVCLPDCTDSCPADSVCVLGRWCTSLARVPGLDCDGDGDGDCWPGSTCGGGDLVCPP